MLRARTLSLAVLALALLVPEAAAAAPPTRIIVKREPGLSGAEKRDIRADAGVRLVKTLGLPRTEVVTAPADDTRSALRELNADPDVIYAERDRLRPALTVDPGLADQWPLANPGDDPGAVFDADIDGVEAWSVATGTGQTVAVVDTGIDPLQPDLAGRIAAQRNFVGTDGPNAADTDGHGTHVSGVIAAERGNGKGIAGVAPDARIMALRALGSGAAGFDSDIADAFRYAGANGARVVNASFGAPGASQTLRAAIHAYPATLFVVSSGNSGADNDATPIYPCNTPEPNVVCVGATTDSDQRASYSNFGRRSVDVFAPGDRILTTTRVSDGFYENLVYGFGTSFATPHVAATAALLLQVEPTLTAEELKEILLDTSETLADHRFAAISVSGGRLNANDAVHLAQTFFTTEIPDNDGDGWVDRADACPTTKVVGSPDGCPLDDDWDGKVNAVDNCDLDPNPGQQDGDRDGIGDACDPDWDNDRVLNVRDNCSTTYNPTQANRDGDRLGDACDSDRDGDGRLNVNDRCPDTKAFTANGCPPPTPPPPTVLDRDHDGRVDASDGCPTEPALTNDGCPLPVVAALTAKARKRTATVKVVTSRPATARITIQRKRVRRWVRVARKERVTSDNHVTVRVKGLHRGRHRAVVVLSSGAGSAPAATQRFRVR